MDERHGHSKSTVHVGFLRGDPAEVLEPGQPDVLHDEVEVSELAGHVVDVGYVKGVPVQRPDGWALVYVDVSDSELATGLEIAMGPRVVELPAAGISVPFCGVELDPLEPKPLGVGVQLLEASLAIAGVEVVVVGELVGVGLR